MQEIAIICCTHTCLFVSIYIYIYTGYIHICLCVFYIYIYTHLYKQVTSIHTNYHVLYVPFSNGLVIQIRRNITTIIWLVLM